MIEALEQSGFKLLDKTIIPARAPILEPVPSDLEPSIGRSLSSQYATGLYAHQARAITSALEGKDICLSTKTASGKSLVFMAAAAHILLRNPEARVLALYPAKALIHDQMNKWASLLSKNNIRVGYIHGGMISREERIDTITKCQVILMTPDVLHAWLMANLSDKIIRNFLSNLHLVVLDEAHVYDGIFGSNMAFLIRRLQHAARDFSTIVSTATLGNSEEFVKVLTGRGVLVFDSDEDGSGTPEKHIYAIKSTIGSDFESQARLLNILCDSSKVPSFLAFADSRKCVEHLVSALQRHASDDDTEDGEDGASLSAAIPKNVFPYRAGYEEEDRLSIQKALGKGTVSGVVSTSALELGLDIGELNNVVLLGLPMSIKAFWQRIGRAGRKEVGYCIVLDNRDDLKRLHGSLTEYLKKPLEQNRLYLENRYCQYANALCAAHEARAIDSTGGRLSKKLPYRTLPDPFMDFVKNEQSPHESIPTDLMPLKQRGGEEPHREFPIRSGIDPSFKVANRNPNDPLGTLTLSQMLREAYPGAVYYHMAKTYRVHRIDFKNSTIFVKPEKHFMTKPKSQTTVFPKISVAVYHFAKSSTGFLMESEIQVSERVTGFVEYRGKSKFSHKYDSQSAFRQKDLCRFFETTGVCWYFHNPDTIRMGVARAIMEAFCSSCGIETRDVGVGLFHIRHSPLDGEKAKGICIYDATNGSLRLTEQLFIRFEEIVTIAMEMGFIDASEEGNVKPELEALLADIRRLENSDGNNKPEIPDDDDENIEIVIAKGEQAVYLNQGIGTVVTICAYRYTPKGLMYQIDSGKGDCAMFVRKDCIQALSGETRLQRYNLVTDVTEDVS